MEKFNKYWKHGGLLSSLRTLNTDLKRMPKHSATSAVMWEGKLTDWKKVNEQLNKYYPDYQGTVGSNIPKYNSEIQYLEFTSKGWKVTDKPSFDEEE